ncbi:MAG: murein biosynthesis integral membrane protein MurJ [Gammaproteobacteria bacterium]|nr:murein biosynthesis integral membrane protein MurJ [Gammaproteobacteria bacterium]
MSKSLLRSTSAVSSMTLLSRVLGFLRDMIAAHLFGATAEVDAFLVAFKIPNFMRNLFAEGALQQSFIPVLSEYHQKKTLAEIKLFTSHLAGCLSAILIPFCVLGMMAGAPVAINLFAPGFNLEPHRFQLAVQMLHITFPYIFFLSLTAFMASVLNTFGNFLAPAFTSSILNICMIVAAIFLSPFLAVPVESQAYAVLVAGILQIVFLAPYLYKLRLLTWPRLAWHDPGVKRVLKLMVPSIFGASIGQISILVGTIFASFLPVGSIAWLYFSERLAYFPLGVIAVALATVILPHLSRQHASQSFEEFKNAFAWGIRCNLLVGTLASITLWFMATPIIITLFKYGKFTATDVFMTGKSTVAYAVGLQAFMLNKLLVNGFFAKQNIKTPVKIGVITVVINIILDIVLIFPLAHAGLALASSLSQWCNTGILFYMLHKQGVYKLERHWLKFLIQLFFANAIAALIFTYAAHNTAQWVAWHATERFIYLFLWLIAGTLAYLACLWVAGIRKKHIRT